MEPITNIIILIIGPFIVAFISNKLLKDKSWIIIGIETIIIFLLTFIGIIENNPTGNTQRQLNSYFGTLKNEFYLKYLPFLLLSIILMYIFRRRSKSS
ncbi:MAG: hypothetical protein K0S61_1787 [Anaerocolumna sp.]|jgi:amino acid transporter|nr:hypothetical protein [Anaerocolumna sp.]